MMRDGVLSFASALNISNEISKLNIVSYFGI